MGGLSFRLRPQTLWELACQRRRHQLQQQGCLTHRHREQARSYSDCVQLTGCNAHSRNTFFVTFPAALSGMLSSTCTRRGTL
ncbi:hypothetical protein DBR45_12715 [Pseudomonas sp. HMWF031]|nr:hypothetical protein DBR45_12715 [Pseudomonas sp. HMWF031]